jgi:hypothetical protein
MYTSIKIKLWCTSHSLSLGRIPATWLTGRSTKKERPRLPPIEMQERCAYIVGTNSSLPLYRRVTHLSPWLRQQGDEHRREHRN